MKATLGALGYKVTKDEQGRGTIDRITVMMSDDRKTLVSLSLTTAPVLPDSSAPTLPTTKSSTAFDFGIIRRSYPVPEL
jgi:hypothetical protein